MAAYLMWAIAGFVLIIAELMTGTFYLLVIGVAALAAAVVADSRAVCRRGGREALVEIVHGDRRESQRRPRHADQSG